MAGANSLGNSAILIVADAARLFDSIGAGIGDDTAVRLNGTGGIEFTNAVTETVGELFFDGLAQPAGAWGASGSGAQYINDTHFAGAGILQVQRGSRTSWSGGALIVR